MDWRCLNQFRKERGANLYVMAQKYAHYLWQRGVSARAVLALNRALYADVPANDPVLIAAPIPYRAFAWFFSEHGNLDFMGNPRVSYQHQADRMRGERLAIRRARAWACWYIARQAMPDLEADSKHPVDEPNRANIAEDLNAHGSPTEAEMWQATIAERPFFD